MRTIANLAFVVAFVIWAVLEFGFRGQYEAIQDILFWIGMGGVLLTLHQESQARKA